MPGPVLSPLHLVGSFRDPFAGAELELPDLARALAARRQTAVWSDVPPHPVFARQGVRQIRPFAGALPRGGMILLGGVHVDPGVWLRHARPERVALRYNLAQHERLFAMVEQIRDATAIEPELLFVSEATRLGAGLPGMIERSLIHLEPFLAAPVPRSGGRPFTIGRLSRDVPDKHHADDPALYRMLAARGFRVRVMGGTCLANTLQGVQGVELMPAGAEPAAAFLASLDAMFYRTGTSTEAYGRVIFEAMASGLPVVASPVGGYADSLTPGVDGLLVVTQESAFAALDALAADARLRQQMGEQARQTALRLHGPQAIERQLAFYLS
jgi:glycosyltransferase involved in cell wall biosynthesis